jgi:PAS domain S-box-containing protein
MQFPFSKAPDSHKARDFHKAPDAQPENRQTQMAEAFRNFQQCIQHCERAVFFTDEAGILQRVNPAFERLTGYSSMESVGKDLSWIAAGEPLSETYRKIWQDIFEGRTFSGSVQIRRRDGTLLCIELTAIPVRDTKGRITNLVCTGQEAFGRGENQSRTAGCQNCGAIASRSRAALEEIDNLLMSVRPDVGLAMDLLPPGHPARQHLERIRFAVERGCELAHGLCGPEQPLQTRGASAGAD